MGKLWAQWAKTARLMVGVKDYDAYVASRRRFDPKAEVMSREAFFRRCQDERYGGKSMKSVRAERWRLVMVERPAWPGVFHCLRRVSAVSRPVAAGNKTPLAFCFH